MACIYTEHATKPVVEIRVIGRVTQHDMDEVLPKLIAFIKRHGKVRLVEIIESLDGVEPSTILDGMKFDFQYMRDISHAAVVTDVGWIGVFTRAASLVMPVALRVFSLSEIDEARNWAATADLETAT